MFYHKNSIRKSNSNTKVKRNFRSNSCKIVNSVVFFSLEKRTTREHINFRLKINFFSVGLSKTSQTTFSCILQAFDFVRNFTKIILSTEMKIICQGQFCLYFYLLLQKVICISTFIRKTIKFVSFSPIVGQKISAIFCRKKMSFFRSTSCHIYEQEYKWYKSNLWNDITIPYP